MRITKDIETRKNEILQVAIELFNEKGYEKTSMSDISKKMNVSQGLCYRYYKSKEEIYEKALEYNLEIGVSIFKKMAIDDEKSIFQKVNFREYVYKIENEKDSFYEFYHKQEHGAFHDQLQLNICTSFVSIIEEQLLLAIENGEIKLEMPKSIASFLVFGQLGIMRNKDLTDEEKDVETIKIIDCMLRKDF